MTRLLRGGREVCVDDALVTEYLEQGYSVIDNKGNVIDFKHAPTYEQLIRENNALQMRVKQLEHILKEQETKKETKKR